MTMALDRFGIGAGLAHRSDIAKAKYCGFASPQAVLRRGSRRPATSKRPLFGDLSSNLNRTFTRYLPSRLKPTSQPYGVRTRAAICGILALIGRGLSLDGDEHILKLFKPRQQAAPLQPQCCQTGHGD